MRSRIGTVFVLSGLLASPAAAQAVAQASVNVTAQFSVRTSLKVSGELLRFDVTGADAEATASLEFSAGMRTPSGADVMLTVEPLDAIDGPGGAADVDATLRVAGEGEGLATADMAPARVAVVGRWQGSGFRQGRLVFTLRAAAPGSYAVPVRLVISTP